MTSFSGDDDDDWDDDDETDDVERKRKDVNWTPGALHASTTPVVWRKKAKRAKTGEAVKRVQWTYEESVNIWKGVQKYGEGNWKDILESYKFHSSRTNVGVKDRWRTMVKTNLDDKIARDMKK